MYMYNNRQEEKSVFVAFDIKDRTICWKRSTVLTGFKINDEIVYWTSKKQVFFVVVFFDLKVGLVCWGEGGAGVALHLIQSAITQSSRFASLLAALSAHC